MGVRSDGSYGIRKDVIYGFPVSCSNGQYQIVPDLPIDDFSRERMDASLKEIEQEIAEVSGLLG
jgi:malate dehydrogenase